VQKQPNTGLGRLIVEVSILHTIRHTHARTPGGTPLSECSARRRGRYLHNTPQTQQKNIYAFSMNRTRDPRNQAASDLHLRPHCHRDRHISPYCTPIWQRWPPYILARVQSKFYNISLCSQLSCCCCWERNGKGESHIFKYRT